MKSAELMKLHNGHFPQSYAEISELLKDAGLYDTTRSSAAGEKKFIFCSVPLRYRSLQYADGAIYNGRIDNLVTRGACLVIDSTITKISGGNVNTETTMFWSYNAP
jgi:hypothetical protein